MIQMIQRIQRIQKWIIEEILLKLFESLFGMLLFGLSVEQELAYFLKISILFIVIPLMVLIIVREEIMIRIKVRLKILRKVIVRIILIKFQVALLKG